MVLFCALEDSFADYKVSFTDGLFACVMSASLAFFTVHTKRYLPKVCLSIYFDKLKLNDLLSRNEVNVD